MGKNELQIEMQGTRFGGNRMAPAGTASDQITKIQGTKMRFSQDVADKLCQLIRDGEVDKIKTLLENLPPTFDFGLLDQQNKEDKLTALHTAVRYYDVLTTRLLLTNGANVNTQCDDGSQAIHYAAKFYKTNKYLLKSSKEKASCIEVLIAHGANVNAHDKYDTTPLHHACEKGHIGAVKLLLECPDIIIESTDKRDSTALHKAARHGHESVVGQLLAHNTFRLKYLALKDDAGETPLLLACHNGSTSTAESILGYAQRVGEGVCLSWLLDRDYELHTPLHAAVHSGNIETFNLILQFWEQEVKTAGTELHKHFNVEKNKYVDLRTIDGSSCLHLAASMGKVDMLEAILGKDPDVNLRNNDFSTPLYLAAKRNHISCVERLLTTVGCDPELSNTRNVSPFMVACQSGSCKAVRTLVAQGADVTRRDIRDNNCLHLATVAGQCEVIKILLDLPEFTELLKESDKIGNTAVHLAAMGGDGQVFKLLVEHIDQFDTRNDKNETALHLAAHSGHYDIIRAILSKDSSVLNKVDEISRTALHHAASGGHLAIIEELMNAGANAMIRDHHGRTVLDICVANGSVDCANVLLEREPDILSYKAQAMGIPLHTACSIGCTEMVALLLHHGADVTLRLPDGRNPLDVAIDNHEEGCAELFIKHTSWEDSMSNVAVSSNTGQITTPMRRMIELSPSIAEMVLSNCMQDNSLRPSHSDYEVTFNYKFIDDMYEVSCWNGADKLIAPGHLNQSEHSTVEVEPDALDEDGLGFRLHDIYDHNHRLKKGVPPYSNVKSVLSQNHPLQLMVNKDQKSLLQHPTVTSLLNYKWMRFGQYLYWANLASYIIYLVLLNVYMTSTPPRFAVNSTATQSQVDQGMQCIQLIVDAQDVWGSTCQESSGSRYITTSLIIAFSSLQLIKELFQIAHQRLKYFLDWSNYIELALYSLSILVFIDTDPLASDTGIREKWQWECGAFAVLISWMNLLLYVRRSLSLGIYVFMVGSVAYSFLKFAIILVLCLLGFSFSFYVLLQNQYSFYTPLTAIVKTFVMMVGEMDYSTIFLSHYTSTDYNDVLQYSVSSFCVFVVFVVVMGLLVSNLLVGLAVDDIASVQKEATLKRLALQVTGILDMEYGLPSFLQRRWLTRIHRTRPNKHNQRSFILRWLLTAGQESYSTPQKGELEALQEDVKQLKELISKLSKDVHKI